MERAKRFGLVVDCGLELETEISYDEYLFDIYGIKAEIGSMKHYFARAIIDCIDSWFEDDGYWNWAERTMTEEEFCRFCDRQESIQIRYRIEKLRLKRKALSKGYLTFEEYAKI